MRKKEEERKAKEAEKKRREDAARRLAELRAREAKERLEREKEKERKAKEEKERKERLDAEARAKDLAEKLEKERKERERLEKEAKEAREREAAREAARKKEEEEAKARAAAAAAAAAKPAPKQGSSYAFSGLGERTSMWPNGRPPVPAPSNISKASASSTQSKPPPPPTAKSYVSSEDTHSYRPYDTPKKHRQAPSVSSFGGSEASWAPSQTTTRTTPPASVRGPYTTKDPDKIVIQAVYLFMNQFSKTPASQLVSGVGSVTDGLILRITTEGLFIDDDVRGVPQREWDVKAWTLKLIEVWCPPHCLNASASASSPNPGAKNFPHLLHKAAGARSRNVAKTYAGEDADLFLTEMLCACKNCCRIGLCERTFKDTNIPSSTGQTGGWKSKGLHLLRATIGDQEGKRYLVVLDETEAWKVAVGLQRLRRGTQATKLGVGNLTPADARGTLEMLGWAG